MELGSPSRSPGAEAGRRCTNRGSGEEHGCRAVFGRRRPPSARGEADSRQSTDRADGRLARTAVTGQRKGLRDRLPRHSPCRRRRACPRSLRGHEERVSAAPGRRDGRGLVRRTRAGAGDHAAGGSRQCLPLRAQRGLVDGHSCRASPQPRPPPRRRQPGQPPRRSASRGPRPSRARPGASPGQPGRRPSRRVDCSGASDGDRNPRPTGADPGGPARPGTVGQGRHRRRRRGHGGRVRGLPVPGRVRRLDPLRLGSSSGGLRRLPHGPGCQGLRITLRRRRLAQRRPRQRPSLRSEPPLQADAARPLARAELPRGARALRHRRPARRPLLRTSEPRGLPATRRTARRPPRGPRGHCRRQRAPLPRGAGGAQGGRGGGPGEGRVPGHPVARAADAPDRDRRVGVPAPGRPAPPGRGRHRHRHDHSKRQCAEPDHRPAARRVADRHGQAPAQSPARGDRLRGEGGDRDGDARGRRQERPPPGHRGPGGQLGHGRSGAPSAGVLEPAVQRREVHARGTAGSG